MIKSINKKEGDVRFFRLSLHDSTTLTQPETKKDRKKKDFLTGNIDAYLIVIKY